MRRIKNALSRAGFYIALSVCLALIGGAAWFARSAHPYPLPTKTLATAAPTVAPSGTGEPLLGALAIMQTPAPPQLLWPVSDRELLTMNSGSEPQWSDTLDQWQIHNGIDISASPGEAVQAAADGSVTAAYKDALLGYTIELTGDAGLVTRYSNLAALSLVSIGDRVRQGQTIASVGDSADAESALPPHLHYEAYRDGQWALDVGQLTD